MSGTPGTMNSAHAISGCHGVVEIIHARHHRWISRKECCRPSQQRGHEGRDADGDVVVATHRGEKHPQAETQDGRQGAIKECGPVAAKLDAEATAGKAATYRHLPGGEATWRIVDVVEGLLILHEREVLADGRPGEAAHLGDGGQADAVTLAALKLRKRVELIAVVDHEHVPVDIEVYVALVQSQEGHRALHSPQDARGVGRTLHEQAPCA